MRSLPQEHALRRGSGVPRRQAHRSRSPRARHQRRLPSGARHSGRGRHDGIGDRALGNDVDMVATLGGAQLDGTFAGGLLPVIKHMPGHGRATVDSHNELPQVDATMAELEARDFTPFRLIAKRAPLGMTAHVVYLDVDDSAPATLSSAVIANIIRERIGFDGALMTDDLSMGALSGDPRSRAVPRHRCGLRSRAPLQRRSHGDDRCGRRRAGACRRSASPHRCGARRRRTPDEVDRAGARSALRLPPQPGRGMNERYSRRSGPDRRFLGARGARDDECLVVDVAGFEGPLDLLLDLAREQKVDLAKISILALAEQYLSFIEAAPRLRIEIAADYLVMAAWLAYLKSRLLLPEEEADEGPSGEELALAACAAAEASGGDPRGGPPADGLRHGSALMFSRAA